MKKLIIDGRHKLTGTIEIGGAKNSAVALIPASILSDEKVVITNVPNITDRDALDEILKYLGSKITINDDVVEIDASSIVNKDIPESVSTKLRASYYFMGSLLGKFKKVSMFFPGGCPIGARPINLHLKGFEALGAKVTMDGNKYVIEADELIGNNIYLDNPSVGATINIMLAAVKATGVTMIDNASKEPEIVNVATFLNNMGAKIIGAGTSNIKITGVTKLSGCFHEVIPDRIEAGTYIIAGALVGENLKVNNIIPEHLEALILKLKEAGVKVEIGDNYVIVNKPDKYKSIKIKTQPHPGFPTDLQQPLTTLMTQCQGTSMVEETIWENRFLNLLELEKMGAKIRIDGSKAYIDGPQILEGTEVSATDLRGGACLVLAGLIASSKTTINNIEHILRGYENIVNKLNDLGAKIELIEE